MSTGEFRAVSDASASTAEFRAFAEAKAEQGKAWQMAAPSRSVAKMAVIVVGAAVLLGILAFVVLG
jgi:hypothetical protein